MTRRLLPILALATILPTAGAAQQSTDGPYVLHEYVDKLDLASSNGGASAAPAEAPLGDPAVEHRTGEPPALSLETRPGEPIYDRDGPVFDRPIDTPYGPLSPYASANLLDDRTDRVDSLTYFAAFDPSVIPYKRVVAKNHAVRGGDGQYRLEVFTSERRAVKTSDSTPAVPSDVFWGTFLLRLERNRLHPIASISPDQRILQIVTEPNVPLRIERDGADNFFVRADQDALVRVNMQVAVPSFYFGGPLPELDWDAFGPHPTPPLDTSLRAHTLAIAQRVGFTRTAPPADTIVEMVRYFRDFDARPFPKDLGSDDLLQALVTSQLGVCRHRSLAFVFLARALGFDARYVYNEAHAFVEVHWPGSGWRRLDLGGAANELNASANDGRPVHDPGSDGLPTPDRFLEEQQRMSHNGWEPPPSARGPSPNPDPDARAAANGGNGAQASDAAVDDHADPPDDEPPEVSILFEEPPEDERPRTRLQNIAAATSVRRGDSLLVRGELVSETGEPLPGREVDVYLGPIGSTNTDSARRIGTALTGDRGGFEATVEIPRQHAIGRWSLFLYFRGDAEFRPAVAE